MCLHFQTAKITLLTQFNEQLKWLVILLILYNDRKYNQQISEDVKYQIFNTR